MRKVIEVRNLYKLYRVGDEFVRALDGVDFEIYEGEFCAIVGTSGSGKSTLLKSLNRMNDLVEGCKITGQVTLDGTDIYRDLDVNLLRKRVGMVFQKPNPFPVK